MSLTSIRPTQPHEWQAALNALPDHPKKLPAFFFAHGQPNLVWPPGEPNLFNLGADNGPHGRQVAFLKDFGRTLLEKYQPKAILVFSAHWETPKSERLVSDYGDENPLLYDYYGFPKALYEDVGFRSKGDSEVSRRVVEVFKEAGMPARLNGPDKPRGRDGRGGQGVGLDHGVFVPFTLMWPGHGPHDKELFPIPIVEASIAASESSHDNEAIGRAVSKLRSEGILILAGGLTIHTFQDFSAFDEAQAKPIYKQWDQAIADSVAQDKSPSERRSALHALLLHPGYKKAHPQPDHFMPLYVAAGAGDVGSEDAQVLSGLHGALTIAFGL